MLCASEHVVAFGTFRAWSLLKVRLVLALQICKMWPIKGMLINASRPETALCCNASMPVRHAIYFGDIATATDVLGMRNRLTCYIFVLDSRGRIRWRNSGRMLADEGNAMLQAITALLST
jgi:hypothetical protein